MTKVTEAKECAFERRDRLFGEHSEPESRDILHDLPAAVRQRRNPAVTGNLLFLGFFFIVIGMPVNAMVVLAADWLAAWLAAQQARHAGDRLQLRRSLLDFAVKIFLTQAR